MEKFLGMEQQKYFELSNLIVKVFSELKDNKNKTPEMLCNDVLMFVKTFYHYPIESTIMAFEQYMRHNNEIPCPSIIITLIDPEQNPVISNFIAWERSKERENKKLLDGRLHQ